MKGADAAAELNVIKSSSPAQESADALAAQK